MFKRKNDDLNGCRGIVNGLLLTAAGILLVLLGAKAFACSAYLDYEYTDGMYRICVYNHLGSRVPVAYNIVSTCPLSIQVPHG